jgi:hypothetical protein
MSYLSESKKAYEFSEIAQQPFIDIAMKAYGDAKKEIDAALIQTYAKLAGTEPINYWAELVKYDRYTKLSKEITDIYRSYSKLAGKATQDGLTVAMKENYNRQQYLTGWLVEVPPVPINHDLLKYSVTGNMDIWKKIQTEAFSKMWGNPGLYTPQAGSLTQLLTKNYAAELDRILQAVQNGFITGKSYTNQSKAIADIIGKYIKSTDTGTGARYNALRIARTEGQRVLNAGALANAHKAESYGINVKKQWLAAKDTRTRNSHQHLDGVKLPLDGVFKGYNGSGQAPGQMGSASENIHCRCTTIDIVDDKNPEVMRARNPETGKNEVISFSSYEVWAKNNGL